MKMVVHSFFTTVCGLSDSFVAQRGGNESQKQRNITKMVLPLNDILNRPKCDEYCALSSQRFVDYRNPSSHKEEETESQREGNRSPKWRKWYEDGALNGPKCDENGAPSL